MLRRLPLLILFAGLPAWAAELDICFNYGCQSEARVHFPEPLVERLVAYVQQSDSAPEERRRLADVVGQLYREAGTQSPIHADRKGDYLDQGVYGKMDCIDHSESTTRMLAMLEAHGAMRFHRLIGQQRRSFLIFQHFSAALEELERPLARSVALQPAADYVPYLLVFCDCQDLIAKPGAATEQRPAVSERSVELPRFVIDSWFVEHGEPAVVLPLGAWLGGEGPNVQ